MEPIMSLIASFHEFLAYLTVTGFAIRFLIRLTQSPLSDARWMKIAPHVIDTLLLVFGITLAVSYSLSPFVHSWILAKVVALLAYIGFGVMAMRAQEPGLRWGGFCAALACGIYIILVAITRSVLPLQGL